MSVISETWREEETKIYNVAHGRHISYPVGTHNLRNDMAIGFALGKAINEVYEDKSVVLVCQGSSGALISAWASQHIEGKLRIEHVRKEGESSHSKHSKYNICKADEVIIIDDFIESGGTINRLYQTVEAAASYEKCDMPEVTVALGNMDIRSLENLLFTPKAVISAIGDR